ncbi:hypothetical protein A2U01_0072549 [Trifolium medium]|uniref:Uncharacterized protein n=1 Tax=Trifolium medium TaxID=97028 RepID=A0A392STB9_9FABA|nr:hypothetical protein [Trifolium medium]
MKPTHNQQHIRLRGMNAVVGAATTKVESDAAGNSDMEKHHHDHRQLPPAELVAGVVRMAKPIVAPPHLWSYISSIVIWINWEEERGVGFF